MAKLASLILHSNIFIDYDLKFLFVSDNTEFMVNDYVQKCNFFLVPKSFHATLHLNEWEFQVTFYCCHSVSEGLSAFLGS